MTNTRTVDQVIADNISRIRKTNTPPVSQKTLAMRMGAIDGGSTNRSRVADLETGRDGKPRPASWQDVVTVAFALSVPIEDIVLPSESTRMIIAQPAAEYRDEVGVYSLAMGPVTVDRKGALEFLRGEHGSMQDEIRSIRAELHANRIEMQETLDKFSNTVIERNPSGVTVEIPVPPLDTSEDI